MMTMTSDRPFAILLCACLLARPSVPLPPVAMFPPGGTDQTSPGFVNTIAPGPSDDTILLGGVNQVFLLDSNLQPLRRLETGPLWDDDDCFLDSVDPSNQRQCVSFDGANLTATELRDNRNLALVVHPTDPGRIVVCGTHRNGLCRLHSSFDLGEVARDRSADRNRFSVSNDSAVLFVGPGPNGGRFSLWMGAHKRLRRPERYKSFISSVGISVRSFGEDGGVVISPISDSVALSCEYDAEFIAAFGSSGFTYFLANLPAIIPSRSFFSTSCFSTKTRLISKIIQACQSDPTLRSHVETSLSCSTGKLDWTILRAATLVRPGRKLARTYQASNLRRKTEEDVLPGEEFIAAVLASELQPRSQAVCFYPVSWVRRTMVKNLRRCFSESLGETGSQFPNSVKCKTLHMEVRDDYCRRDGCDPLEGPLSGVIGIDSTPSYVIDVHDDVTAMTSFVVDDSDVSHTTLFLGTRTGKLLKVLLDSFNNTSDNRIYKSHELSADDSSAIHKGVFVSMDTQFLFASTQRRVYKVPVTECDGLKTCVGCLSSADPMCGWCSLEDRCSTKSSCFSDGFEGAWLEGQGSKPEENRTFEGCPVFVPVNSKIINLDTNVENITVRVRNLPAIRGRDSSYRCSLRVGGRNLSTDAPATHLPGQLSCSLIDLRRALSDAAVEENLDLRLFATDEGAARPPLQSTEYLLITCNSIKNCSNCIGKGSNPTCGWCFSSNRCTKMNRCPNLSEEPLRMAKRCPRIINQFETSTPSGVPKILELRARNLPAKTYRGSNLEYFCKVEGHGDELHATYISESSVHCHLNQIAWAGREPKVLSAQIFWRDRNASFPVENIFKITVFNCSSMSEDDCSLCQGLNLSEETRGLGCVWCKGRCRHSCQGAELPECPDPRIEEVTPLSGPMQGGTLVTLYGSNLGAKRNFTRVTIGGVECSPVDSSISKKVACRTNPSPRPLSKSPLKIQVDDRPPATTSFEFSFTRPLVHSIHPTFGPSSGRTMVTIHGKDLTFHGKHDFEVDVGSKCTVNESLSTSTRIVCERSPLSAPPSSLPLEIPVRIKIDWANVSNERVNFQVTGDPVVSSIHPPSTFKSGGCSVHVRGQHLNSSSSPVIKISGSGESVLMEPSFFNGTFLEFPFPPARTGKMNVIFIFDGVQVSRPFEVTEDPRINHFSKSSHHDRHLIEFQGEDLLGGCGEDEVSVHVGQHPCNVSHLSDASIVCSLPQNGTTYEEGRLQINVTIGNLEFSPGSVQLASRTPTFSRVDTRVPIVVGSIVGVLLILVFLGVLILMRKISTSRKRNSILMKRIQVLEKTISVQCKQSFAELQTHVSGFSSEISDSGIPYWDFQTYAFKFLFPMLKDHEVLRAHGSGNVIVRNEKLQQLNQLLCNKSFLVTFIRTLEGHPREFGIEDRSKIASWLTVIFMDKLEYTTIVMKELLEELIRKSLERNTQKMMLRRTESVVEKMLSNWLCLTMYHYIKVEVGRCLYRLCKAIEYQVDDGPVDAITQESKFSLAEERLLRVKVDPQALSVTVLGTEGDSRGPAVCKLFDCDTISQAKCKAIKSLYKNRPRSSVPSADDFEIRLATAGQECGLILRDEDSTSATSHDWIQLNTVKHYNVRNGDTLVLALHPRVHYNEHDNAGVWKSQETVLFDSTSNWGTIKRQDIKNEPKVFHLVKQDELHSHYDGSEKLMSEVFLPRLLITKKALEDYIRKLFEAMMSCDCNLPPTVKFLFDFFDSTAQKYNIVDPDVVHIWKSNSLPLRFWVSVLRNPDFIFDIEKSSLVDPCLAVIAQVFIDGCSTHKHQLGLDSSSAKLLFANEMQSYRSQVEIFYSSIKRMPAVDRDFMNEFLHAVETEAESKFNTQVALQEVLAYVVKFQKQIQEALDADVTCCSQKLPVKFHQIFS